MTDNKTYDVIIIGGSYSGLSAAMALGRSLRNVLVIDSGKPCNAQTPHSHNFLTRDGERPAAIAEKAKEQVMNYKTVTFCEDIALTGKTAGSGYEITTLSNRTFSGRKLIFATGVKDVMPEITGFSECWGISAIHCPYCHGFEVRGEKTGILANGEMAFEFAKLITNWTKDLTLFTNGRSTLTEDQASQLQEHGIQINEKEIAEFRHTAGKMEEVVFTDGSETGLKAMYAKIPFVQHCAIPEQLGCELTETGHLKVDAFQKTTVNGIFACGDNTTMMRSVSSSVAAGTLAGALINKELVEEDF